MITTNDMKLLKHNEMDQLLKNGRNYYKYHMPGTTKLFNEGKRIALKAKYVSRRFVACIASGDVLVRGHMNLPKGAYFHSTFRYGDDIIIVFRVKHYRSQRSMSYNLGSNLNTAFHVYKA